MKREDVVIGASEAAAALDLDDYTTPLELYARKLGLIDDVSSDNEATFLGRHVEHSIVTAFEERHNVKTTRVPSLRSTSRPWMRATPDRVILPSGMSESFRRRFGIEPGEAVNIECKTTGLASHKPPRVLAEEWGAPGSDHVPRRYVVQAFIQMLVLGEHVEGLTVDAQAFGVDGRLVVTRTILPALLPSRGLVDFVITSNPATADAITSMLTDFVEGHLVPEVPPDPVTVDDWRTLAAMATKAHSGTKAVVDVPDDDDVALAIADYLDAKQAIDDAELKQAKARELLVRRIADGYAMRSSTGKALLTAPTEVSTPKLALRSFADEVIHTLTEEAIVAPSPVVDRLLALVDKHTRSHMTARQLRVTRNKQK